MVIPYSMKRPIFVRPLSDAERKTLEAALRSPDAFTLRRSARSCSLATGAKMPTRSLTSWAAIRKRGAQRHPRFQRGGAPGSAWARFEASAYCSQGFRF